MHNMSERYPSQHQSYMAAERIRLDVGLDGTAEQYELDADTPDLTITLPTVELTSASEAAPVAVASHIGNVATAYIDRQVRLVLAGIGDPKLCVYMEQVVRRDLEAKAIRMQPQIHTRAVHKKVRKAGHGSQPR
jgi:hypothetical protein